VKRAVAVLLGALLVVGCGGGEEEDAGGFPVSLARVEGLDLAERIEGTGELRAKDSAAVAAEVAGRVTDILVDEGNRVEAGAPVLAIDPERRTLERDSALARLNEARAQARDAAADYKRVRDLKEKKVASQQQLEQAETDHKLAQSRLAAAEAELGVLDRALRDATVTAPFAGFVAKREVSRGEYVQPGQTLFELVALDPIEVEFRIPEVDLARVEKGQVVAVSLAPFPDEIFEAVVTFVAPTIDSDTRTLRVKAELENPEGRLRPGLFARIDLGVANRTGVAMIPEDAVLQRADGEVVFRVGDDNRVERLVIETGERRNGMVEIARGPRPGEYVVARGQAWLTDGQLVSPRNPDGTPATRPLPAVAEGSPRDTGNVP
jgi:membrane fusion protein (multidrug efflux system)